MTIEPTENFRSVVKNTIATDEELNWAQEKKQFKGAYIGEKIAKIQRLDFSEKPDEALEIMLLGLSDKTVEVRAAVLDRAKTASEAKELTDNMSEQLFNKLKEMGVPALRSLKEGALKFPALQQ